MNSQQQAKLAMKQATSAIKMATLYARCARLCPGVVDSSGEHINSHVIIRQVVVNGCIFFNMYFLPMIFQALISIRVWQVVEQCLDFIQSDALNLSSYSANLKLNCDKSDASTVGTILMLLMSSKLTFRTIKFEIIIQIKTLLELKLCHHFDCIKLSSN